MRSDAITAGELRERVTLLVPTEVDDGQGGRAIDYVAGETVWSAVREAGGREVLMSGGVQTAKSVQITIRYRADVTPQMRLRRAADGADYELVAAPRDLDGRRRWLELAAVQRQGAGA